MKDLLLHKNFYLSSQISERPFLLLHKQPLSLHISSHHCTFCASLHAKTSPPCTTQIYRTHILLISYSVLMAEYNVNNISNFIHKSASLSLFKTNLKT